MTTSEVFMVACAAVAAGMVLGAVIVATVRSDRRRAAAVEQADFAMWEGQMLGHQRYRREEDELPGLLDDLFDDAHDVFPEEDR